MAGQIHHNQTRGRWEYVSRSRGIKAAVILAVEDGHVLLVEQYRVHLGQNCLELPAGLIGDHDDGEKDDPLAAAGRELKKKPDIAPVRSSTRNFFSSPGMISESFTLVQASDLEKVGPGGGVDSENITVHRVALADLDTFIADKRAEGCGIDVRLLLLLGAKLIEEVKVWQADVRQARAGNGRSQGLGAAHDAGWLKRARVLLTDINGEGAQAPPMRSMPISALEYFAIQHDVTDRAQWDVAVDAAREHLGGLNVLVNNAGIQSRAISRPASSGSAVFRSMSTGFSRLQAALPLMRDHAPGYRQYQLNRGFDRKRYDAGVQCIKGFCLDAEQIHRFALREEQYADPLQSVQAFVDTPILDGTAQHHNIEKGVLMDKLGKFR